MVRGVVKCKDFNPATTGPVGIGYIDSLADSPPIRFSLLLRDDFPIEAPDCMSYLKGATGHVQGGMVHHGHLFTQSGSNPPFIPGIVVSTQRLRFENPAYTVYDASAGISKVHWAFTVYGENLTNSNVAVLTSTDQFIVAQTPMRPRVIGAKFGYSF